MSDEALVREPEPIGSPLRCSIQADRQALPRGSHGERPMQASRRQEHGAADARGPRAQQASKLETRALFAGSEGGTVARAGGNACGPLSVRLDLKARGLPRSDTDHTGPFISLASAPMAKVGRPSARRRFRVRMRSHRRALKSIGAVKIRRIGRSEWMWRLAVGAD